MRINAILTKPLDGAPEGTAREFDKADFDMLEKLGAVRRADAGDPQPEKIDEGDTVLLSRLRSDEGPRLVAGMKAGVEMLERDNHELGEKLDAALADADSVRAELATVRAELEAARSEVDAGKASVVTLSADLDDARKQLGARSDAQGAADAFDHDGDGKPGGSKPKAKAKEA